MADSTRQKQRGKGKPWPKGTSGNPRGRKPGSGLAGELRKAIAARADDVLAALIERALQGDVTAGRVLLDRIVPALRTEAMSLHLPELGIGTFSQRAEAALRAAGNGEVAPDTAAALVAAVGALVKIKEVDELERRIAALEEKHDGSTE